MLALIEKERGRGPETGERGEKGEKMRRGSELGTENGEEGQCVEKKDNVWRRKEQRMRKRDGEMLHDSWHEQRRMPGYRKVLQTMHNRQPCARLM